MIGKWLTVVCKGSAVMWEEIKEQRVALTGNHKLEFVYLGCSN